MKRMSRNRATVPKMNLTSLMDVFTILVFFLLVNSATTEVLESPRQISLPESLVEEKPRETVVILISPDRVSVQGKPVATVEEVLSARSGEIQAISDRLSELEDSVIGTSTKAVAASREVTILADRSVPFRVVKSVMSTCTGQGYERISLAVTQRAPEESAGESV